MQTSYLQYLIEIERTRSITQAAANLYLTQPSLSRILHETEQRLGYAIFERTNRGVRPTEEGVAFLRHAKHILAEMEAIEGLGNGRRTSDRLRVGMPRSAGILAMAADYLAALPPDRALDGMLRECHVRQALDYLASGEIDLAIIRFRSEYRNYFEDQAAEYRLSFEALNRYRYRVALRADHPIAQKTTLEIDDLEGLTEITHGDTFRAHRSPDELPRRCVYSVDRCAQMTLLSRLGDAYMWVPSMQPELLARWGLVQREVADNRVEYQNALIAVAPELLSDLELGFMEYVRANCKA